MRATDVHDTHVTFTEKDHGVHLLEETLHRQTIARIQDLVTLKMGEGIVGQGFTRGKSCATSQLHNNSNPMNVNHFFISSGCIVVYRTAS